MADKKFNLFDFMIEIHQNFIKENPDVESMCVLDSLAVGNYNNREQFLFLWRFSKIWEKVEQRELNRKK
tara:strand:- start:257 stop:463 length:207 start_codon:yes stop_codon:yes gene_type:complete